MFLLQCPCVVKEAYVFQYIFICLKIPHSPSRYICLPQIAHSSNWLWGAMAERVGSLQKKMAISHLPDFPAQWVTAPSTQVSKLIPRSYPCNAPSTPISNLWMSTTYSACQTSLTSPAATQVSAFSFARPTAVISKMAFYPWLLPTSLQSILHSAAKVIFSVLRGKALSHAPLSLLLAVSFLYMPFVRLREFPSVPRWQSHAWMSNPVKCSWYG